jgi:hypothetical protein
MTHTTNDKPGRYRSKLVEVEAIQWKPETMMIRDVMDFFGGGLESMNSKSIAKMFGGYLRIETKSGILVAAQNEWVVRYVGGTELWTCGPETFKEKYEPTDGTER